MGHQKVNGSEFQIQFSAIKSSESFWIFISFNTKYAMIHASFTYSKWNMYLKKCFWTKNDGKKWSRKNIFEIPPLSDLLIYFIKVRLFPLKYKFSNNIVCAWRELPTYLKGPVRTEKSSIFNFEYVNEVWIIRLLGVKNIILGEHFW